MTRPYHKTQHLSEAHIQQTCSDYLALDGWRRIRTDLKHLRGMGVQEKGMADDLYIRFRKTYVVMSGEHAQILTRHCDADVLWIEWKRAKKSKLYQEQTDWHLAERARGALTWIAGEDFTASIEGFQEWYRKSGLMQKNLR